MTCSRGLGILAQHPGGPFPLHCEHDTLYALCSPDRFTADELDKLKDLGFFIDEDEDCFKSYRFGSA